MRVKHCTTKYTSAIKPASYAQRHHPVQNIGQDIVLHETGGS